MMAYVRRVGQRTLGFATDVGRAHCFLGRALLASSVLFSRPQWVVRQLYAIGVLSLPIILVSGAFVGLVLGLQGHNILVDFGAEESVGVFIALSLLRELGPVVTGLLFAGRACSALTAEIALMRATEQLDGLEMMALDPMRWVIAPRLLAGIVALPCLTLLFVVVGIYGGYLIASPVLGIDGGVFWSQIQANVDWSEDVLSGILKSVCFAVIAVWVALWNGYNARPTADGMSRSTTYTVVSVSLYILATDFVLTALLF